MCSNTLLPLFYLQLLKHVSEYKEKRLFNSDLKLFNVISYNTDKHFTIYQALSLNYLYASSKLS